MGWLVTWFLVPQGHCRSQCALRNKTIFLCLPRATFLHAPTPSPGTLPGRRGGHLPCRSHFGWCTSCNLGLVFAMWAKERSCRVLLQMTWEGIFVREGVIRQAGSLWMSWFNPSQHVLSNSRGAGDSVSAGFVQGSRCTLGLRGFETGLYLPHLSQSLLAVCWIPPSRAWGLGSGPQPGWPAAGARWTSWDGARGGRRALGRTKWPPGDNGMRPGAGLPFLGCSAVTVPALLRLPQQGPLVALPSVPGHLWYAPANPRVKTELSEGVRKAKCFLRS